MSESYALSLRLGNRRCEADAGVRLAPLGAGDSVHPDVALVVFNSTRPAQTPSRAVVYIHGGGFVTGSATMIAPFAGYLQRTLDAAVISVDYRLAPIHPFPAAVEDAAAAIAWIVDNAPLLNVHPSGIVVTGDSAGGNLAMVRIGLGACGVHVGANSSGTDELAVAEAVPARRLPCSLPHRAHLPDR